MTPTSHTLPAYSCDRLTAAQVAAAMQATSAAFSDGQISEAVWENRLTELTARREQLTDFRDSGRPRPGFARPSIFRPKAPLRRNVDPKANQTRRRRLASAGPMPPQLAARFTEGERAALAIVLWEIRDHGSCDLSNRQIVKRSGACLSLHKRAIRLGVADGLLHRTERPRQGQTHETTVLTINPRTPQGQQLRAWLDKQPKRQPPRFEGIGGTDATPLFKPVLKQGFSLEQQPPTNRRIAAQGDQHSRPIAAEQVRAAAQGAEQLDTAALSSSGRDDQGGSRSGSHPPWSHRLRQ